MSSLERNFEIMRPATQNSFCTFSKIPVGVTVTANLYDIFRQENRAKNRGKAAENQKRRFQKAWFSVPAFIFECSKTKTGGFSAGLIFSTNVV